MPKAIFSAKTRMNHDYISLVIKDQDKKLTFTVSYRGMKMTTTPNINEPALFSKLCRFLRANKNENYGTTMNKLCIVAEKAGSIAKLSASLK